MRISKEPEERKQEILETAMKMFYERGYDQTQIGAIAKEMNVSQGLCYRYFSSKEVLFETALEQYAQVLVDRIDTRLQELPDGINSFISELPRFIEVETEDDNFYKLSHGGKNKNIHVQLSIKVCGKLMPIVKKFLNEEKAKGHISIEDVEITASFIVFGQLGVLMLNDLNKEEKINKIGFFLSQLLLDKEKC